MKKKIKRKKPLSLQHAKTYKYNKQIFNKQLNKHKNIRQKLKFISNL